MLRIWLALAVGVLIVVASGVAASLARAQSQATSVDPVAIVTAYETARDRRDLDGSLAYFADDATVTQRGTTFSGTGEIRKFLDGVSNRSRFLVVADRRASGTHVTWTERSGGPPGGQPQVGGGAFNAGGFVVSVEAVVQDGKIRSLAYATGGQVARTDPALDGRAQLPAPVGLGAVATVAGLLLTALVSGSIGSRPSPGGPSTLRGRLMQDLRGWTAARQAP